MISLKQYLIQKKKTPQESELLIRSGKVLVNDEVVFVPSQKIKPKDKVLIKQKNKWVSRGALKLLPFVEKNNIDFKDKVVLDIGSSTGGFTQVALEKQAYKVYALDVGTNQLDYSLRINPKVFPMEKTNLKQINDKMFKEFIDLVLVDVSFISLKNVFEVLSKNIVHNKLKLIALIKPQFEASSWQVEKGGVVPLELHKQILFKVEEIGNQNNFILKEIEKSEIKGKKSKNQEYLALFEWKK